jgi:inward rectifier potassium channel
MAKKTNRTGFGEKYSAQTKRVINPDGSFNVIKIGAEKQSLYQYLIGIGWGKFALWVLAFYLVFNSFFATVYMLIGVEYLAGLEGLQGYKAFLNCFFFSVQTFTTVGYGVISPTGMLTNIVATLEAMIGLMGFALATGLLYGRFSRPTHSIRFSKNALVVHKGGNKELHFQIVNTKNHLLMDLEATVMAKVTTFNGKEYQREFYELDLLVPNIRFFPLNWRLVHRITPSSPLCTDEGKSLMNQDMEVLILIRAYDSTFNQIVRARYSYTWDEIIENAQFERAYETNEEGDTVMHVSQIDAYTKFDD